MDDCTPETTPPARLSTIYALLDADGNVRYVGVTCKTIEQRLREHWIGRRKEKSYRANWLRSLSEPPSVVEIEQTYDRDREIYWIAYYRELGCKLTNTTDGGEGVPGLKHTAESLAKMSAAHKGHVAYIPDDETKGKISRANSGKKRTEKTRALLSSISKKQFSDPAARAKAREITKKHFQDPEINAKRGGFIKKQFPKGHVSWNKGKTHSPDAIARMCASHQGYKPSEETKAKMSAAQKRRYEDPKERERQSELSTGRKHTEESRAKLSRAFSERLANGKPHPCQGRACSQETREKLRAAHRGRALKPEHCEKLREAWVRRKQKQAQGSADVQIAFDL